MSQASSNSIGSPTTSQTDSGIVEERSDSMPIAREDSDVGDSDLISTSLDAIRRENEKKNSELTKVKMELSESKLSETQLKEKVYQLTKEIKKLQEEKESLEQELHQKKTETEQTTEELQQEIAKLKSQLQEREAAEYTHFLIQSCYE